MSEQQQPKEHCGHECVCFLVPGIEERIPDEVCSAEHCEHDTRSRPDPTPQTPTHISCGIMEKCMIGGDAKDGYCCNDYPCYPVEIHWKVLRGRDAAIAKQSRREERERLINLGKDFCAFNHPCALDSLTAKRVSDFLESLREGAK